MFDARKFNKFSFNIDRFPRSSHCVFKNDEWKKPFRLEKLLINDLELFITHNINAYFAP